MPYTLPQQQPRQTGWDQAGFATGTGVDLLLKVLLAQMGAGGGMLAPKNIPNPGYGQTGTTFSQPQPGWSMAPPQPQNPQAIKAGFQQAAPYATKPMINQQQLKTLSDLQQMQHQAAQTGLLKEQTKSYQSGLPVFDNNGQIVGYRGTAEQASINPAQGGGFYQAGDVIERGGKRFKVVSIDTDGMPLVEPE